MRISSFKDFIFEFKQDNTSSWIAGSKVVSNGKPIVVYHGTNAHFKRFDASYMGQTDDGFYGQGFYFTEEIDDAKDYGNVIMEAYLKITNPFYLRSYSSLGSAVGLDLRDDLAKLKGMPVGLKTIRTMPEGYHINKREYKTAGDDVVEFAVWPDEKFYGTDKEIYGPDVATLKKMEGTPDGRGELMAIVAFNDMVNKVSWNQDQANRLLQDVDRNNFHNVLMDNGYDGIFVVRSKGDKTPIEEVSEFVVWNPDQIKIIKTHD